MSNEGMALMEDLAHDALEEAGLTADEIERMIDDMM